MVKKLTYSALHPFLNKPKEKLHLAEISKIINTPHPTARLWLNDLEKAGVLRKDHKGKLTLYYLNLENPTIIDHLAIAEKLRTIKKYEESLIIKELASMLHKILSTNNNAIIFGSMAENPAKAQDIDLLITGKINDKEIKDMGNRLNKAIHLINVETLKKINPALREEIIKKHMIIWGVEGVLRWMLWSV